MTISKIEIAAFAGLKNYTLDFENGFNVIHGENEQGKTTVMAFIKMMFYGSGRSGKTLAKNMRQKYLPWSGEPAGGRIYFEQNGHRYCLERLFKKSDSTDRVTLRDLDLGKEETVGPDIGKSIFGLSEAAFERSVFIGQTGILENDETAKSELNARLSNLTTTGDESMS
ncbi:MAG: AAA family ATPase [Clostridia bacterium]|nr:AAA family ATPase [Clostridia bacterium]